MSDPKPFSVSVVIPAYNAEPYIVRTIESVLAQTHPPDEIIVVDDGSTDQTAERVKHYDAHVRYIHQPNAGASQARNTGIKAANSEWIAFLDADDEWLPEKLESQMDLLQRNPGLVWTTCNYTVEISETDRKWPSMDPQKCDQLLAGKDYFDNYLTALCQGLGWNPLSMIIKRHVIEEVGFFRKNMTYVEDINLNLRISYRWPKVGYVNRPLAIYHNSVPGSFTREMSDQEKWKWDFELYDRHLQLSAQHGQEPLLKNFILPKLSRILMSLYLENQFDTLHDVIRRYRKILSFRCRSVLRLLTLPGIPNNAHTREIIRKLLIPERGKG